MLIITRFGEGIGANLIELNNEVNQRSSENRNSDRGFLLFFCVVVRFFSFSAGLLRTCCKYLCMLLTNIRRSGEDFWRSPAIFGSSQPLLPVCGNSVSWRHEPGREV